MMGWFYGFKLHLIINNQGSIISVTVTTDNVDDRKPISEMVNEIWGCLYGNKGYISGPLERELADKRVDTDNGCKKNIKPKVMKRWDRRILRKRFIIETVSNQLKNISRIGNFRHRSEENFIIHLIEDSLLIRSNKKTIFKITWF